MYRPADDQLVTIKEALEWQRTYVLTAGAPVAAETLSAVIGDVEGDRLIADLLPDVVRFGDLPGLRVMAAVHLLALQGRAPRVAAHAPSLGGVPPTAAQLSAFHADVIATLVEHASSLLDVLSRPPQTNEVGRAPLLRCALTRLGTQLPVRLREFGCSAGLNLRADHLQGRPELESGPMPVVADRVGCDLQPIDASTLAGQRILSSYVWMDDVERMNRLRAAFVVAEQVPVSIVVQDAADFVADMVLKEQTTTAVWHSAMWLYLRPEERRSVRRALGALAATASPTARLAHISWEWAPRPQERERVFHLILRTWMGGADDGRPLLLAEGNGHGGAVRLVPDGGRWLPDDPLAV